MGGDRGRAAWQCSTRKQRLPANWESELRPEAHRRNPTHVCHWCGLPDGNDLDHKQAGDDTCQDPQSHPQPCQCNLDWTHGRNDVLAGRSPRNCHGEKSGREGAIAAAAAMRRQRRPEEPHPAFT